MPALYLNEVTKQLGISAGFPAVLSVLLSDETAKSYAVGGDETVELDGSVILDPEGNPVFGGSDATVLRGGDAPATVEARITATAESILITGVFPDVDTLTVDGALLDFTQYDGTVSAIVGDSGLTITPAGFSNPLQAFDITPPVLLLNSSPDVQVTEGDALPAAELVATDDSEGNVSGRIVQEQAADPSVVGEQTESWYVEDSAGNRSNNVTRTVNVVASAARPFFIRPEGNFDYTGDDGIFDDDLRLDTVDVFTLTVKQTWLYPESIDSITVTASSGIGVVGTPQFQENVIQVYAKGDIVGRGWIRFDWVTASGRSDYATVYLGVFS